MPCWGALPDTINGREPSWRNSRAFCQYEGLIATNGNPQTEEQEEEGFWRGGISAGGFFCSAACCGRVGLAGGYALRAGDGDLCRAGAGLLHGADWPATGSGGRGAQPVCLRSGALGGSGERSRPASTASTIRLRSPRFMRALRAAMFLPGRSSFQRARASLILPRGWSRRDLAPGRIFWTRRRSR